MSPYIEGLKERGIEVLLFCERVDEWMAEQLDTFDGKPFQNVTRGALELESIEHKENDKPESDSAENQSLLKRMKDILGERVEEVRAGTRLRESPACLISGDHGPSSGMRRILSSAGHKLHGGKPTLELNMNHRLVQYLEKTGDENSFSELTQLLFDQAALADGERLGNPIDFVQRLNRFLVRMTDQQGEFQPIPPKPIPLLGGAQAI